MCGIAGLLRWDGVAPERARLERMLGRIAHRGPDGEGVERLGPALLGHRRLAIIDVELGRQPLANEDGSVWVTFNGEIYNHRALRAELGTRHQWRTHSDTEVLVHLYEEHGERMLERLHGMFAFALWDARKRRLLCARDRLGKKPFYFRREPRGLAFASEVKGLLAGLDERPELDPSALNEVLALRYVGGTRSGLVGVERLEPGTWIAFDEHGEQRGRYASLPEQVPQAIEPERALAEYRTRLDAAVARRLESEVPLGLLLSGGLDSLSVLESLARQSAGRVHTFTVAFSRGSESEALPARAAAAHFGTAHAETLLGERDLLDELGRMLPTLDEPFGDPSLLPTMLVCRKAKEHATVCLTGDGGDELFGGYKRYRETLSERDLTPLPALVDALGTTVEQRLPRHRFKAWKLRRELERRRSSVEERYVARLISTESALRAELLGPRARVEALAEPERRLSEALRGAGDLRGRMLRCDQAHVLPGMILTKTDRAGMAAGVELRSPLLDHELLEWSATLPHELKTTREQGKVLMRRALEGRVPPALLGAKKRGFGTPLSRWFRGELAPLVDDHLLGSQLAADGWLDARAIAAAVRAHRARARNLGELLWTLLCAEAWYRNYVRS